MSKRDLIFYFLLGIMTILAFFGSIGCVLRGRLVETVAWGFILSLCLWAIVELARYKPTCPYCDVPLEIAPEHLQRFFREEVELPDRYSYAQCPICLTTFLLEDGRIVDEFDDDLRVILIKGESHER